MTLEAQLLDEVARLNARRANEGARDDQLSSRLLLAAEIAARLQVQATLLHDRAIAACRLR